MCDVCDPDILKTSSLKSSYAAVMKIPTPTRIFQLTAVWWSLYISVLKVSTVDPEMQLEAIASSPESYCFYLGSGCYVQKFRTTFFFFFHQILFVGLTTPPCDILQCEFSSLNYHFIHFRLQLSINTVLPYSKDFHPLWRRNKTQIKQFFLLLLDDFFFKSYSSSNEVCPVFIAFFFCKSNFDFLLQSLLVLVILPIPWNYNLSC